uniref:Uncharacterized protein n=1 Tax=Anguilla anguilla TaxID=7936 RepID=A0A0E9Q4N2_ANGAN
MVIPCPTEKSPGNPRTDPLRI